MNPNYRPPDYWIMIDKLPVYLEERFLVKTVIKKYGGCRNCGWCCRNERLSIFPLDVKRLGKRLKPEYIRNEVDGYTSFHLPCPYITEKNRCRAYNLRPGICKTFPFIVHYQEQLTISMDCPLGLQISTSIKKYCISIGMVIKSEEDKTPDMIEIDKRMEKRNLNSGDGYTSNIMNVPFEVYDKWLKNQKFK